MSDEPQALALLAAVPDARLRAALACALTTVLARRGMAPGVAPAAPFDLGFFAEAVKAMFSDELAIRRIVDGRLDELRWGPPWDESRDDRPDDEPLDEPAGNETLTLSHDEALVLFELLARTSDGATVELQHRAERVVLWSLHAQLEQRLVE